MGERAERIVVSRGDLGHQPELGEAKARAMHPPVEECGDAARGEPGVPAGAAIDRRANVGDEGLGNRLRRLQHRCMHMHHLHLHA